MDNINGFADLHIHSNHSDGQYSPKAVIDKSLFNNLQAIAIVDHDDISALPEAITYGDEIGLEVITGVELSVNYKNSDLHILAYCFDYQNSELVKYLKFFREERIKRAQKIVHRLAKLGMPVSFEAVLKKAGPGTIGRPHIAELLVKDGYVYSFQEAFNKFIGDGKPANVKKYKLDLERALAIVKAAGGICSVAHPGLQLKDEDLLLLMKSGVHAIEVIHPKHSEDQTCYYSELARSNGLLETGGSDFHGGRKGEEVLGKFKIPYEVVTQMKELAQNQKQPRNYF
ncbi:MAG: PHP domain-containing protein [bacterium]